MLAREWSQRMLAPCRLVSQVRRQPPFELLQPASLTAGIAGDLVVADAPDREVPSQGMREIQAADARGREHRRVLGQRQSGLRGAEQIEQLELLAVIRAGGVAESWTDTAMRFRDHLVRRPELRVDAPLAARP